MQSGQSSSERGAADNIASHDPDDHVDVRAGGDVPTTVAEVDAPFLLGGEGQSKKDVEGSCGIAAEHDTEKDATEDPRGVPALSASTASTAPTADVESYRYGPAANSSPATNPTHPPPVPPFEVGDHVYRTSSFLGLTLHHGIVLDLWWENTTADQGDGEGEESPEQRGEAGEQVRWILQIFDYAPWDPHRRSAVPPGGGSNGVNDSDPAAPRNLRIVSSSSAGSCVRLYESDAAAARWRRVEYGATSSFFSAGHWTSRSGTYTSATSGPPGLVKARAEFMLSHPHCLPPPTGSLGGCPGECAAVWAKTGSWGTLQSASWLGVTAAGQVKSTATLAGVASTTQVTVPAAGLWGWFGYTTQVPFLSLHPYVAPAIAAYGVVTVGAPLLVLWSTRRQWRDRTDQLHHALWSWALEDPQRFAEMCLATTNEEAVSVDRRCNPDHMPPPYGRSPCLARSHSCPSLWTEALAEAPHRIRWNSV